MTTSEKITKNKLGVRTFATIEELRQALRAFKEQHLSQRILQRHGYRTPSRLRWDQRASRFPEADG